MFYNKSVLKQAGVALPKTYADFQNALPTLKAKGIQPIMLGNADKYPAVNLFGAVAGALVPPQTTNDWVNGRKGATFQVAGNAEAARVMQSWAQKGYLGTGFNGLSADDAATKFGKGSGAFYIAGDWNLPNVEAGKSRIGIVPFPPGASGTPAATGSLGLGWHIRSKSTVVPAAVAFIGGLNSPEYAQKLADQGRVPVATTDVQTTSPLFADDIAASGALIKANGQTGYLDWATDTMYDESGARMQEMLAGRITPQQMLAALQKNWTDFQKKQQ
jgi:raffinose/stachyose/melibiose transport system substrate-binding protein